MGFLPRFGLGRPAPAAPPTAAKPPAAKLPAGWGAENAARPRNTPPQALLDSVKASLQSMGVPVTEVRVAWLDSGPALNVYVAAEKDLAKIPKGSAFQGFPVFSAVQVKQEWSPPDPKNPW